MGLEATRQEQYDSLASDYILTPAFTLQTAHQNDVIPYQEYDSRWRTG